LTKICQKFGLAGLKKKKQEDQVKYKITHI
jgi:hypothetical protein